MILKICHGMHVNSRHVVSLFRGNTDFGSILGGFLLILRTIAKSTSFFMFCEHSLQHKRDTSDNINEHVAVSPIVKA